MVNDINLRLWGQPLSFCGGGGVCTVIFVSDPTTVLGLRLCCVVGVGVVTILIV